MDKLNILATLIGKGLTNAGKAGLGSVGAAAAGTGYLLAGDDEKKKERQAKKYTEMATMAQEALKEFGFDDSKKTDLSKGQVGSFNVGDYANGTTGAAADAAGFASGTGGAAKTIGGKVVQRVGANTLLGGAQAIDDSENIQDFATNTLKNTAFASAGEGTGKLVKEGLKIPGKIINSIAEDVSKKAQMSVAKTTPERFMKAVQEHGVNINDLVKKYYPKGATYDDVLGDISDRSGGGFLQKTMSQAEDKIQKQVEMAGSTMRLPVDDIVDEMTAEVKLLKKIPGNETNVAALEKFVKDTKKIYKNGVTAKQALAIKRAADSKFGKSIADEDTGSVINQGQKMLANYFRGKLKQTFPEIADALDTQSEIFTLKPLLEKSRAISNTAGSEIRAGKIANVQMFNPLSWGDVYLDDAARASKLMSPEDIKGAIPMGSAMSKASDAIGNAAPKGGQLGGLGLSSLVTQASNPGDPQNTQNDGISNNDGGNNIEGNLNNQSSNTTVNSSQNIPQPGQNANVNLDEVVTITNQQTGETKQVPRRDLGQYGLNPDKTPIVQPQQQNPGGMPFTSEQLMQGIIKAQLAGDVASVKEMGKVLETVVMYEEMEAKKVAAEAKTKPKTNQFVQSAETGIGRMKQLYGFADDKGAPVEGAGLSAGDSTTGNLGLNSLISQGNVAMKKQDQGFKDKLETYNNFRAVVIPMLNQAIGAGTPQAGEMQNLIATMPNENSSAAEASAWFENVQFLLEQAKNNPIPGQQTNYMDPQQFNQLQPGY